LIEKALSEAARKALDMESQIVKFFSEAKHASDASQARVGRPQVRIHGTLSAGGNRVADNSGRGEHERTTNGR
jgi:hypothetical protein